MSGIQFVTDAKGRKLWHSEDVFIWDPFIQYTFDEAGAYFAIVQPTHRHNDPNFAYQLDIRTAPLACKLAMSPLVYCVIPRLRSRCGF